MGLTGYEVKELEELTSLLESEAWKIFVKNIIFRHKNHLYEQAHTCLKKHEDRKAGEYLARAEEWIKLHVFIIKRIKDLKQKQQEGGE